MDYSDPAVLAQRPCGAFLTPEKNGVTFKVWAPNARAIDLLFDYVKDENCHTDTNDTDENWHPKKRLALQPLTAGYWGTYVAGAHAQQRFMYDVSGPPGGSAGEKRDPRARELSDKPAWPDCHCVIDDASVFPWHDDHFRAAPFHELRIYQLHVGSWFSSDVVNTSGTFLDVMTRLPYLSALGINAIQLLPVVEYPTEFSLGYNGVDYFSPETDYGIRVEHPLLENYLNKANALLRERIPDAQLYSRELLASTTNQLRLLIDLCHVYGISVILDVVFNHAGGDFGDKSLYFFDRQPTGDQNRSLYFTDVGWAGGLVFAYWNADVRQFLIDNALMWLEECHADGFRYDEVSVIVREGGEWGYTFCQHVTDTCRYLYPSAIHIGEHWPPQQHIVSPTNEGGAGFDACLDDGLREAVRSAVYQASLGAHSGIDMDRIANHLPMHHLRDSWRAVQMCENHDIVRAGRGPRIPALADGSNPTGWYARSRSRVALGLVGTAPGILHLFMGQELLESRQWNDSHRPAQNMNWSTLQSQNPHADFLWFTQDLLKLRAAEPALTSSGIRIFHTHNDNRVIAFHRWVPFIGKDIVVVASFNENTFEEYWLGFPFAGSWQERFNSDVYESGNYQPRGNGGQIVADGGSMHGFVASSPVVLPANSILVFVSS